MTEGQIATLTRMGLQPRYTPVSQLPTTPLQQSAIAIIFLMTSLAFITWAARMYERCSKRQVGIGEFPVTLYMRPWTLGLIELP
jgi:hypothetical protein